MSVLSTLARQSRLQLSTAPEHHFWVNSEEQYFYELLLNWVQTDAPWQVIRRFQTLFIEGKRDSDRIVAATLDQLIQSDRTEQRFNAFMAQCCQILVRHWQLYPQHQDAIPKLIGLFEYHPTSLSPYDYQSKTARRLKHLIHRFTETETYLAFKKLAIAIANTTDEGSKPLGLLIQRYPFLYEHYLLSPESTPCHQQYVAQYQLQAQETGELRLSRYVLYQVRKFQREKHGLSPIPPGTVNLAPMANPTLMSDRALILILKQFVGKLDGFHTRTDLAEHFRAYTAQGISYRGFKEALHEYLTDSIDPAYGQQFFNQMLHWQLQQIAPQSDDQPLTDFLFTRTCNQLLSFLVVQSPQNPDHRILMDLLNHVGPLVVAELLLKLVLLCGKVRVSLERKLALLLQRYEACPQMEVQGIVQLLEILNIAFTVTFGKVDLAYAL